MLYNHYDKIRKKNQYRSSLNKTQLRIIEIERDLKNCNFNLSTDMQSTDYSKEQIQSSVDNSSSMEKDMIREESKLERELEEEVKYKNSLKRKIRNMQRDIDHLEVVLETLQDDYIKIIKLLYKDKLSYRAAAQLMHCTHVTIKNYKQELVNILISTL